MTSKQVELYLEAARMENLTLAAEKMYVSKATMSRQLAALEDELGYRLFWHRGNAIRLTPEGEILRRTFEKMNAAMAKGFRDMDDIRNGRKGHLVLGFTSDMCIPDVFLREIDLFKKKYPDIEVSYVARPFTNYVDDMADGVIDFMLAHDMEMLKYEDLDHLSVAEAKRGLYYSIRHPLAEKEDLSVADFAEDIHWASVNADTPQQRESLKQISDYYGIPPFRTKYVTTTNEIVFHLLLGEGFSTMDDFVLQSVPEDIRILPIDESLEPVRKSVFWNRNNANPCIRLFCEIIRRKRLYC